MPLVAGMRWSFRGKDAGTPYQFNPGATEDAASGRAGRGPAAQTVFRRTLLVALEERRRLERVRAFRGHRRFGRASEPSALADAGHDHRHPDLSLQPLVDGRTEDDVGVVSRRLA